MPRPEVTSQSTVVPAHLEKLSWYMDKALRIPGTQIRFGIDSVIGLIPGIGDVIGLLISAWVVLGSVQAGAKRRTVARMLFNIGRDALLGSVPLVGDVFDIGSRANTKNMELLRADLASRQEKTRRQQLIEKIKLWLLVALVVAVLAMAVFGFVSLVGRLFR